MRPQRPTWRCGVVVAGSLVCDARAEAEIVEAVAALNVGHITDGSTLDHGKCTLCCTPERIIETVVVSCVRLHTQTLERALLSLARPCRCVCWDCAQFTVA